MVASWDKELALGCPLGNVLVVASWDKELALGCPLGSALVVASLDKELALGCLLDKELASGCPWGSELVVASSGNSSVDMLENLMADTSVGMLALSSAEMMDEKSVDRLGAGQQ